MNPVLPASGALGPPPWNPGTRPGTLWSPTHANPGGNYRPGIAPGSVRPEGCNPYAESGFEMRATLYH